MSILIHGMKMPKNCGVCFVGDRTICKEHCPLIEIPPHGRLGDLGELEIAFNESAEGLHGTPKWAEIYRECAKAVREAETIIPADPAKEEST